MLEIGLKHQSVMRVMEGNTAEFIGSGDMAVLAKLAKRKDQKEYTRAIEEALKEEISPMLWKMTRYEGKILLKLIDRETNHTVFGIIKDFRSGFTAGFYQMLAKLFGNNLKLEYDPEGEDEMLEYIVKCYKAGIL